MAWGDEDGDIEDETETGVLPGIYGDDGLLVEDIAEEDHTLLESIAAGTVTPLAHHYISDEHNTLSRYISECSDAIEVGTGGGVVTSGKHFTPLHIPAYVPGHSHHRLAVYESTTTKLACDVVVTCGLDSGITGDNVVG